MSHHKHRRRATQPAPGAPTRNARKPGRPHPPNIDRATWEWLETATPAQREHYARTGEQLTTDPEETDCNER